MEENPSPPAPDQEEALAQWQEPQDSDSLLAGYSPALIVIIAVALAAVLVGLGFWQRSYSYYVAAAVAAFGGFALVMQQRMPSRQLQIVLGGEHIQIGTRTYALAELAGFWLEAQDGYAAVNFEPKKAAMIPITVIYPGSLDEARQTLLQVLPELEARQKNVSDSLGRYIRF